jgi:inner membrane protein
MMGKTHLAGGVFTAAVPFAFDTSPELGVLFAGGAVLGSLLPDIDHADSTIGRRLVVVSLPIQLLVGHRGATHSLLAAGVAGAAAAFAAAAFMQSLLGGLAVGLGLAAGYVSHPLLDAATPHGVRLLAPFSQRRFKGRTRTGGLADWATGGVLYALAAALLVAAP